MSNYFSHWRNRKYFQDKSTNTDIKNLKEIVLRNSRCTTSKASWRVIPKDSCEVYKDRRKRQIDTERNKVKRDENERNKTRVIKPRKNINSRRISKKASSRRKRPYNRRERYDESSTYTPDSSNYPTNSSNYTTHTSTSFSTFTSNSYSSSMD